MTMLGLETEYDDFIALLNSVDAKFHEYTGVLKIHDYYGEEETIKTKDIVFTDKSALGYGTPCLRFNAETGKFLGGWCDD